MINHEGTKLTKQNFNPQKPENYSFVLFVSSW